MYVAERIREAEKAGKNDSRKAAENDVTDGTYTLCTSD